MTSIPHTRLVPLLSWLLLFGALLVSHTAMAEPIARVLIAHGDVQAQRNNEAPRQVKRGDELYLGDTIHTGKASSIQFRFSDGALIALRAQSQFRIEQHHYNKQAPQQHEQTGQLLRGGLRAITGAIGSERPEAVKVRTPVSTIGIRGTVYETFYISAEGHPDLPDVAPGHYLLVLRGRVALNSDAGEIILGSGEIGYIPDPYSAPELRPDLASLFARFAALDSDTLVQLNGHAGKPPSSEIDHVLSETAQPGTMSGPFGFVITDGVVQSRFLSEPVTMEGDSLIRAEQGSGDFSLFDASQGTLISSGHTVAGDSTIYWGAYETRTVAFDPLVETTLSPTYYITATQLLPTLTDLPTTGRYRYDFVEGSGWLSSGSNLAVDFGSATMDVTLYVNITAEETWTAANQAISDFYIDGITLVSQQGYDDGLITGRFVGSEAEGAITVYQLPDAQGAVDTGTAAFTRLP